MKCAKSETDCETCELNPKCQIYTNRYVLRQQLRKFKKELEDTLTIVKAILAK